MAQGSRYDRHLPLCICGLLTDSNQLNCFQANLEESRRRTIDEAAELGSGVYCFCGGWVAGGVKRPSERRGPGVLRDWLKILPYSKNLRA